MSTFSEAVSKFMKEIKQHRGTWNSLETTVMMGKSKDRWLNLCIIIKLFAKNMEESEEKLFEIEDKIIILRKTEKFDFNVFQNLMESLSKGVLRIGDVNVSLEGFTSADYVREKREGWRRDQLADVEGWPVIIFRSYGQKSASELLENYKELIELLHANKEPYESMEQLSKKYLGIEVGSGRSSCIYVVAPLYFKLDNVELKEDGELNLSLKCHRYFKLSDFKLSVIYGTASDLIDNFQETFTQVTSHEDSFIESRKQIKRNKRDVLQARLYLIYRGKEVRQEWIACPKAVEKQNLRLAAHDVLDEDLEKLTEALESERRKLFEPAIPILLHLAGFDVEYLGVIEERLGRPFVDVLAFTPDTRYVVIAGCSVEGLTPDKITKVAEKAKSLRKRFIELKVNVEVVPAFFTPINIEEISNSVKKRAKEDGVAIMCRHTIMDILEKVRGGYSVDQILGIFGLPHVRFI